MTCLTPEVIGQSESTVSVSAIRGCLGVIGLERPSSIGSHTLSCRLWWIATSPNFQRFPHQTFIPLWKSRWSEGS